MIISHKYKFIFIKTVKTAGTSIEVYISQHCDNNDIVTTILPHIDAHVPRNFKGLFNPLPEMIGNNFRGVRKTFGEFIKRIKFYNHIPARLVKARIPLKTWNNYFKFCVERNPWDKTLSHYHMLNARSGGNLKFDEYLARQQFCLNYPKYTDNNGGKIIVDRIVKYENLNKELSEILAYLGIPFDGSLTVEAKKNYRKDRSPYREIFSTEQRIIIEKAFEKEIEMHGYLY